jgi:3-deoxy-7-phosphoheptulonate synthase
VAAGADGITVEVHTDPDRALSDGPQSLYPEQFEKLMRDIEALAPVLGKELARLPDVEQSPGSGGVKHAGRSTVVMGEPANGTAGAARKGRGTAGKPGKDSAAAGAAAGGGQTVVAYQGERGAFGEHAIRHWFNGEVHALPVPEFRSVFDAVLQGKARFGMVPIENSLTGSIHENYDLLLRYPDLHIVGEQKIRIVHNLIGLPGATIEDIRRVFSHPQGLAQCARFLDAHPDWERVAFYDTAGAVRHVAEKSAKENAAIASEDAALVYGLSVLKPAIEANVQNYTRFFVIARVEGDLPPEAGLRKPPKASLCFAVADQPGALFKALQVLAERGLNMQKLESRPIHGKPWEYQFYVDVNVPADTSLFDRCMKELKSVTEDLRVLGTYGSG